MCNFRITTNLCDEIEPEQQYAILYLPNLIKVFELKL